MKLFLTLIITLSSIACSKTDNVGTQCQDTTTQCTGDPQCANSPGTTCGPNGLCTHCATSDMPDARQTCMAPAQPLTCQDQGSCGNYPGTVCDPQTHTCQCPAACMAPTQPVSCQGQSGCANYPPTICDLQTNRCSCP